MRLTPFDIDIYRSASYRVKVKMSTPTIPKDIRQINRFITTHDNEGKTAFSDTLPDEAPFQTLPDGVGFALCYATNKFPVSLSGDKDVSTYQHYTENLPGITIPTGVTSLIVPFVSS